METLELEEKSVTALIPSKENSLMEYRYGKSVTLWITGMENLLHYGTQVWKIRYSMDPKKKKSATLWITGKEKPLLYIMEHRYGKFATALIPSKKIRYIMDHR